MTTPFKALQYNRKMQAPSTPIIVTIIEENEIAGLGDVMLEAIGLTGAIAVGAALFGLVLAVVIIGFRKMNARLHPEEDAQTQPLGLTPTDETAKSGN
jgi:Na+/H+-dicarboxylate symporter